jgi:hypothetical protein
MMSVMSVYDIVRAGWRFCICLHRMDFAWIMHGICIGGRMCDLVMISMFLLCSRR